jgi:hypothetical protein
MKDATRRTINALLGQRAQELKREFEAIAAALNDIEPKRKKPCESQPE